MSAEKENDMDEARKARQRAEEMLSEVRAQQPEIDDLSKRSDWLLHHNSFSALFVETVRSGR